MAQGSVIIDVKAQISGYETSLRQLQAAMEKIDLGSDIGKKLASAINQAQAQLKTLSKNMTPRASSDTQIDVIIERANQAGEAVQKVATLMQQVSGQDLNLGALGGEIDGLVSKISTLQEQINTSMNTGVQKAIKDSEELKNVFESLGTNFDKITSENGLQTLQSGLQAAQKEAEKTSSALNKINNQLQQQQEAYNKKYSNNPFLSGNFNEQEYAARLINVKTPDKIIDQGKLETIQEQIFDRLTNLNLNAKQQDVALTLLDQLFNGLTPENIQAKLNTFINELNNQVGIAKNTIRAQLINGQGDKEFAESLLGIDEAAMEEARNKLYSLLREVAEGLDLKSVAQVKTLIDFNSLEQAKKKLLEYMHSANMEVAQQQEEDLRKITETQGKAALAQTENDKANSRVDTINQAINTYTNLINTLTAKVEQQQSEIDNLKSQLDNLLNGQANQIRSNATQNKIGTEELKIGREAALQYSDALQQVREREQLVGRIQGVVQRWFSIYAVVRMVSNAVKEVISTVKELDKTITEIAIVTNMSQSDLWGQMDKYTEIAHAYASSISGVYKVSQLYYQQGLQTADVMALTEQTLKMARISGLDYATATDYMTNAIRSFKMEMTEAQTVVDVYSAVAASSATDTTELASAMSKTASSAQAVGSSFENTTAMMAVMIEATRESAENIGSALKSIISRYGEMKENPMGIDAEGEEYSLNKVDAALQTVGISIHDIKGEFRDFDDVIMELAEKWDTIDKNTQRYIATVMAGNRQQSRFLALVSSYDRLKELSAKAADSEDASQLQFLKTLDSVEAKVQQFQTSIQSLYVGSGLENTYKGLLDLGNSVIATFTTMPKIFNLPIAAVVKFGLQFASLANIITTTFGLIKARLSTQMADLTAKSSQTAASGAAQRVAIEQSAQTSISAILQEALTIHKEIEEGKTQITAQEVKERLQLAGQEGSISGKTGYNRKLWSGVGLAANVAGSLASGLAATMDERTQQQRTGKAWTTGLGSTLQGAGMGAMFGPWGALAGSIAGALVGAFEAVNIATEDTEKRINNLKQTIEDTSNAKIQSKDELKTLTEYKKKYDELSKSYQQSAEGKEEWRKLNNEIAASYPELIKNMDAEGNYVVDMISAYEQLADAKQKSYKTDFLNNISAELNGLKDIDYVLSTIYNAEPLKNQDYLSLLFNAITTGTSGINIGDNTESIIDSILGKTNKKVDFSTSAIKRFFGASSQLITSEQIKTYMPTGSELYETGTITSESVSSKQQEFAWNILEEFVNAAKQNLSLSQAKDIISDKFQDNNELQTSINNFSENIYTYLQKATAAIQFQDELIKNKIHSANAEWINMMTQTVGLESNDIQRDIALFKMNEDVDKFLKDNEHRITNKEQIYDESLQNYRDINPGDLYKEFLGQYSDDWMNFIIETNNQFSDEALNELYKNSGQYSASIFRQKLSELVTEGSDDFNKILELDAQKKAETIKSYNDAIQSLFTNETVQTLFTQLGEIIPTDFLSGLQNQLVAIMNNSNLAEDQIAHQLDNLKQLYQVIDKNIAEVNPEDAAKAYQAISAADLTSLNAIYDLLDALAELGIDIDTTGIKKILVGENGLSSYIEVNLLTSMETFSSSLIKQVDDFDKALSNASKGMDLDDAVKMADQLKVSITDFRFENGKYFYDNAEAIKNAYYKYNEDFLQAIEEQFSKAKETDENYAELKQSHDAIVAATEQYGQYQVNAVLIQNGFIIDFLKNIGVGTDTEITRIKSNLLKGNYNDLINSGNEEYIPAIMDYINGIGKNTIDKAISSIKGEGKQRVTVTESNKALLIALGAKFIDGTNEAIFDLTKNNFGKTRETIVQAASDGLITEQQMQSYLADLHNNQYKDNITDSLSTIIDNYQSFGYEAAQSLANAFKIPLENMEAKGIISRDAITGQFSTTVDNLRALAALALERGMDIKSYNQYISKINKSERESTVAHVMQDVIKNRTSLTEDNIQSLANSLKTSYDYVRSLLTQNADGTYTMDLATLNTLVQDGIIEINSTLQQLIAEQIDNIIGGITGLSSGQNRGYTNIADMQKYVQQLQDAGFTKINEQDINIDSLFTWNESINAYVLTTEGIISQILAVKSQLDSFVEGSDEYQAIDQLISDTKRQFAENIDVSGLLDAIYSGNTEIIQQGIKTFRKAISDYNAVLEALGESTLLSASAIETNLARGGITAVETAEQLAQLAGKQLSASDVENIYRSQIAPLIDAIDQVENSIGSIVSRETAEIIGMENVTALGTTGQYLVTSTTKLVDAYQKLYDKLLATNEATLADLNSVMAQKLEAKTGANVVSALGNAAEMTYTEFSEILTQAGYMLTEKTLEQLSQLNIIEEIGGGKLRITDFTSFAGTMGWDTTSKEYISAFKSYNDAIVALNHKVEQEIAEEVQKLSSAKPGDKINVTRLYSELINRIDEQALGELNALLWNLDETTIHNGILDIGENANIVKVMQAIYQIADQKNLMLADDLAALADAIDDALKSFADTLSAGIAGTLNHSQANELKTTAKNMFGMDLDFHETANGLKVSRDQAVALYSQLQAIDSIAASIVFDSLRDSLEAAGEDCENITKTMASIKALEAKMGQNPDNSKLQERLNLYNKIAAVQMQDAKQYDFMGRSLPEYLQGPENYWNSIGKAFTVMNESAQSGYMGLTDFYNIVNEMNNLAALGGDIEFMGMTLNGSLESASALIQKGFNALSNIDGTGVKINLGEFGVDFAGGAEDMAKNVEAGIKEMASSQIEMLDGMIALLETVVAMEKLGDITGKDHVLDLGDMFIIEGDTATFTEGMQKWAEDMLTAAETNADLANALDSVIFNGSSLRSMLTDAKNNIQLTETDAKLYFSAINSLYQMFLSGDYDLENLIGSISDVASKSGFNGEIQIGDIKLAVGYGFVLESNEKGTYEVDGKSYTNATEALQVYALQQQGDIENIQITADKNGAITTTGTYTVGQTTFEVVASEGNITYTANGNTYKTKGEAVKALYSEYIKSPEGQQENLTPEQWATKLGIDVTLLQGEVRIDNPSDFQAATHDKIVELANALANNDKDAIITAATNVGIKVDVAGDITETDRKKIAELAGIESKTVVMDISANFNSEGGPALAKALEGTAIDVTINVKKGTDETGLISTTTPETITKEIAGIIIAKAAGFTITGEDTLWAEITTTKEYDAFTAYITKLVAEKGTGFTVNSEDAIWAEITTTKEYEQFIATVKALMVQKIASGFTTDDGSTIWNEIVATKEYDSFTAAVKALVVSKSNGYTTSGLDTIWSDVTTTKEYESFSATVAKILISKAATGFAVDENNIWSEVSTTNGYDQFTAYVSKVVAEKIAQGFTVDDLAVWADIQQSKEYEQFTAIVSSIVAEKAATGFVDKTAEILPEGPINLGTRSAEAIINILKLIQGWTSPDETGLTLPTETSNAIASLNSTVNALKLIQGWVQADETGLTKPTSIEAISSLEATINALKLVPGYTAPDESGITIPTVLSNVINSLEVLVNSLKLTENSTGFSTDETTITLPTALDNAISSLIAYVSSLALTDSVGRKTDEKGISLPSTLDKQAAISALVNLLTLTWANGKSNYDYSNVLPEGNLTAPTTKVLQVPVQKIELTEAQETAIELSTQLQNKTTEALKNALGWDFGDIYSLDIYHRSTLDTALGKEVNDYLNQLHNVLALGKTLSAVDLSNLDALANVGQYFTTSDGETLGEAVTYLQNMNAALQETQTAQLGELAQAFGGIDATNLQAVADAMSSLVTNAQAVNDIKWDTLVNSINSINAPQEQNVLTQAEKLTKEIDAKVALSYDDSFSEEIITNSTISREIKLTPIMDQINAALSGLTASVGISSNSTISVPTTTSTSTQNINFTGSIGQIFSGLQPAINSAVNAIRTAFNNLDATMNIKADTGAAESAAESARKTINGKYAALTVGANTYSALNGVNSLVNTINKKTATIGIKYTTTGLPKVPSAKEVTLTGAKGSVALASGRRQTLMGELGPELYVTNGHYYVAGQNGAEFVDLPEDAIVFNHLQTKKLLENGYSGRGKAVTSEKRAVSYAAGNAEGPAMASASAALAALKQIRAMWQSMLNASLSDLGQQAGGGSGGGGGSKDKNTIDPGFIADLERWYNLLRQIAKLEKDINHEETLRNKLQSDRITNGAAIYESQKRQLGQLNDELVAHYQLATLQKEYYEKRRADLAKDDNPFGKIFTYTEDGIMQYNDKATMGDKYKTKGGLTALATLNAQNADGSTVLTAKEQYERLVDWGFKDQMLYDASGKKIDWGEDEEDEEKRKEIQEAAYVTAVQAFWDKADAYKDEMDSLYDSYREQEDAILEAEIKRNEILQEIKDNQLALEDKVYDAIVDSRQQAIDDAQDVRDALEKNSQKFIDGLQDSLNKERQMYQNEQNAEDLNKMRRRLGILQRSGGSASSIRSLQEQITQKEKDAYFDAQQQQIDAIQDASDKEIEKLDAQIELMTETLEYQKENGLLWNEVAQIMQGSPEQIAAFIEENDKEFKSFSTTKQTELHNDTMNIASQWAAYRDEEKGYWTRADGTQSNIHDAVEGLDENSWDTYDKAMTELYGAEKWNEYREAAKDYFTKALQITGDPTKGMQDVMDSPEYKQLQKEIEELKKTNNPPVEVKPTETSTETKPSGGGGGSNGGGNGGGTNSESTKQDQATVTMIYKSIGENKELGNNGGKKYSPPSISISAFIRSFGGYTFHHTVPSGTFMDIEGGKSYTITYWYSKNTIAANSNSSNTNETTTTKEPRWKVIGTEPSSGKEKTYGSGYKSESAANAIIKDAKSMGWTDLRVEQYAKGGLNTYTGLAMLHGTKTRPESVFDAKTTAILRNDILGHGDSLLSLLVDFKDAMYGTANASDYNTISNSSTSDSVVIEHVDVNLKVEQMSSDYDARRAGDMMKDEMLKIARKNGVQNNLRG